MQSTQPNVESTAECQNEISERKRKGSVFVKMDYNAALVSPTTTFPISPAPIPPNWKEHYNAALKSQKPYKLFPIRIDSVEFETLVSMMDPFHVISAEQIVNPILWKNFIKTRALMIKLKSDNPASRAVDEELLELPYSNFDPTTTVKGCPFNDNMALLFHCTRHITNVDSILADGMKERLHGIYFADDPNKSTKYDGCGIVFVFAVLLGDCVSFHHLKSSRLWCIKKMKIQMRTPNDIAFDSVIARIDDKHTEYVIYDR